MTRLSLVTFSAGTTPTPRIRDGHDVLVLVATSTPRYGQCSNQSDHNEYGRGDQGQSIDDEVGQDWTILLLPEYKE